MSNSARMFSLGAILSITDGHLLAPNRMDDVYEIINFMTGDSITTIGLLSACGPCKAALLEQHPQLAEIESSDGRIEDVAAFMAPLLARYGTSLPVTPLASWEPRSIADDILDVNRLNPKAEIMVIEP